MNKASFSWLARELCRREGKKRQVNIAQVSELLRCLRDIFRQHPLRVMRVLLKP